MQFYTNTNLLLKQIKQIIEEGLEEKGYRLPMPPEEGMQGQKLETVIPKVALGSIPHANFGMYELDKRYLEAPYILIGNARKTRDYEKNSWDLLIQVCCYATEPYEADGTNNFPDNLAFMDCNNLLETLAEILLESDLPLSMPVELGDYSQKAYTYPLAYGYLQCGLQVSKPTEKRVYELY